ncbi:MAG: hypothetical protein QXO69_02325 [archaeon]
MAPRKNWKPPFGDYSKVMERRCYRKALAEKALAETTKKKLTLEESVELKQKYDMSYRPGKRSDIMDALEVDPKEHVTFFGRNKEAIIALGEIAENVSKRKKRPLIINDVGYGERGERKSEAFEPFEIANQLEKKGVDFRISAYTSTERAASLTEKSRKMNLTSHDFTGFRQDYLDSFSSTFGKPKWTEKGVTISIPRRIQEKMKFSAMDIINATPAKQADITLCMNVGLNLSRGEHKVALYHLANSTAKNGYIITDMLFPKKMLEKMGLRRYHREGNKYIIYKKVR